MRCSDIHSGRMADGDTAPHVLLNAFAACSLFNGSLILEDRIHLFKSSAISLSERLRQYIFPKVRRKTYLWYKEVHPDDGEGAEGSKEDVCAKPSAFNHRGCDETLWHTLALCCHDERRRSDSL